MAITNAELVQECSPEHLRMGTARFKYDKETARGRRQAEIVMMERTQVGTKKGIRPTDL